MDPHRTSPIHPEDITKQIPFATLRLLPEHGLPHIGGVPDKLKDALIAAYSGIRAEPLGYIEIQVPDWENIRFHNIRRCESLRHMQSIARAFLLGYQQGMCHNIDTSQWTKSHCVPSTDSPSANGKI